MGKIIRIIRKALAHKIAKMVGYKVVAGFGDVADFTYHVLTAAQALELMAQHPAMCFVQVVNRRGEVVAMRW